MKVIRNTPDELVIDDRPWFWAVLMGFAVLILLYATMDALLGGDLKTGLLLVFMSAFAALFLFLVVVRTKIWLNAKTGNIALRSRSMRGTKTAFYNLADLQEAKVQTSQGETETHRCALVFTDQTVPLTKVYSSGKGADLAMNAINDWLTSLRR